jgi:hypothetical protein
MTFLIYLSAFIVVLSNAENVLIANAINAWAINNFLVRVNYLMDK